jgi:5'-nucleotidase
MRILVSNDDGIYSPGIAALAAIAREFGDVRVVAPDVEQSAKGHSITVLAPLRSFPTPLAGLDVEAYRVNGTPADCVALGLHLWEECDLVLSGINLGGNVGFEVWYSGTVAAARQAALAGVPAIAFSLMLDQAEPNFEPLGPYLREVLNLLLKGPAAGAALVNVNLPQHPRGIQWTRQSVRRHSHRLVEGEDPAGRPVYWVADNALTDPQEGTDRWAVGMGLVSLTPLRLDLTDRALLEQMNSTP